MDQSGKSDIPAHFLENPPEPLKPETGLVGKLLGVLMTLFGMAIMIGGAEFSRDSWVGQVPGLKTGSALHKAMFAVAPKAHHERLAMVLA